MYVNKIVLDSLIRQTEIKPFSYEKLLSSYNQGTIEHEILKIIGELISYMDKSAAMKNTLNQYSDKRTMALAFVRQNVWVKYLLKYKRAAVLEELPEVIQNAIRYMEHPDKVISVFKERRKGQIFKTIFDGKDGDLFECMSEIGIKSKNPMNDGYLYSVILHSKNIQRLWDKSNETVIPEEIVDGRRIWSYAPGEDGHKWDEFSGNGIMAIGWDEVGDLTGYGSKEEIKKELDQLYGTESNHMNDTLALRQFCNEIQIGDKIFAKTGSKTLLGIGEVVSDYEYDERRQEYKHLRKVNWIKVGRWEMDEKFAIKTLTDITAFEEFCEKVERIVDNTDDKKISNAKFQKWFIPLINALKQMNGQGTPDEVCSHIAKNLDLPNDFINQRGGKSNQNIFKNQVAWARNYLKYDGYIDNAEKGVWRLTEKGFKSDLTREQVNEIVRKWVRILQEMKKRD